MSVRRRRRKVYAVASSGPTTSRNHTPTQKTHSEALARHLQTIDLGPEQLQLQVAVSFHYSSTHTHTYSHSSCVFFLFLLYFLFLPPAATVVVVVRPLFPGKPFCDTTIKTVSGTSLNSPLLTSRRFGIQNDVASSSIEAVSSRLVNNATDFIHRMSGSTRTVHSSSDRNSDGNYEDAALYFTRMEGSIRASIKSPECFSDEIFLESWSTTQAPLGQSEHKYDPWAHRGFDFRKHDAPSRV